MSDLELDLRDLSKERFESLIHQLLVGKFPGADITRVEGSGGDEGIDSFQGVLSTGPAVWQCKHFRERIKGPQERQILKSIETAFSKRDLSQWTLCLPINLRTEEHGWFQTEVVNRYGGPEKIKLMQAANIYTDLIISRPLRDEFFPNSSLSNVLKLREVLLNSNLLSAEEKAKLAVEYAQQYIEGVTNIEPRLAASVQIGAKPPHARIPGAIMSVHDADKTTHFFARNPLEYELDPIRFGITIEEAPAKDLLDAIDKGAPFTLAAGQILELNTSSPLFQQHFAEADPKALQVEVTPIVPAAIANREVPVRLVAGSGPTSREIPYVRLRVERVGKREMVLSGGGSVPAEITLTIRADELSLTYSIRPRLQGAEVKAAHRLIEFLDELERSGEFKVLSLEYGTPLGEITGSFSNTLNIAPFVKSTIRDASIASEFTKKNLHLPDKILESDAKELLLLRRMATGEEFFDVEVSSSVIRTTANEQEFLAAVNSPSLRFEQLVRDRTFTVFGQELRAAPMLFEAQNATFKDPDETRNAFLSAEEGGNVSCVLNCAGPCRFLPIATNK